MGQAKNRKAEIMQLKTNPLLKDTVLTVFGTHYKSDQDLGWSITLTNKQFGPRGFNGTLPVFKKMIEDIASNYDKHIGVEPAWPNKEETAVDLFNQLNDLVRIINTKLYGTETQPNAGFTTNANIMPALQEILCFMANVVWLTKNGYLANDNYNGTQYGYESK